MSRTTLFRKCFGQIAKECSSKYSSSSSTSSVSGRPLPTHPLYQGFEVRPDVLSLSERFFMSWNAANFFFFRGSERDLLVDTGTGIHDLRRFIENFPVGAPLRAKNKPLSVVLTHCHFDHSGGIRHFASSSDIDCFIHPIEADAVRRGDKAAAAAWVSPREVLPKPEEGWEAEKFYVGSEGRELKHLTEGDLIHLGGGRSIRVLHLPGHTIGSIGLVDDENGLLVTGDTLYRTDGELIDWYPPGSSVPAMGRSVEKLLGILEGGSVDVVLPGHNECLNARDATEAAERHLEMLHNSRRRLTKGVFSRARAAAVLAMTSRGVNMPDAARSWIIR